MMLATSALMTAASAATASMFSPSRNACMKRVAPFRYRFDPYSASVIPAGFPLESPVRCFTMVTPATASPSRSAMTATATVAMPVSLPMMTAPVLMPAAVVAASMPVKSASPIPRFAFIRFKHETATFLAPFRITVGDIVVVEGDRGENVGTVEDISTAQPSYAVPCKVLRRATPKDMEMLAAQRQREDSAVKTTQALANSLGLHASIEDAEYQFDMNKLTIFVRRASKNAFVDFRKLQRGLFREFRCRIWCAYMDEVEAADEAPRCR